MTASLWRRSERLGTVTCDAVVVGAGICGVSAALALERRGLKTVVLERHSVAAGASGRNAGFLMRGAAENYAAACAQYGRPRAAMLWRWTEDNLTDLRREGIESLPSYQATPSCLLALTESEAAELEASAQMLAADGFEVRLIRTGEDSVWRSGHGPGRAIVGLVNPNDAAINPCDLVRHLAAKLKGRIYEQQEAVGVTPAGNGARAEVQVRTTDGEFRASRVVLCTNAYTGSLLPDLRRLITPRRGQMLALRGPGLRLEHAYYANHGYEYFRQTPDGTVVIGGCRKEFAEQEIGCDDVVTDAVQGAIETFARGMLGGGLEVVARWSGVMGFSPDGLPLVGPVDRDHRVWLLSACTGHGMSMAYRTAQAGVDAMLDSKDPPFPLARFNAAV
jgi:gamma-glutamylputrescine oxidase